MRQLNIVPSLIVRRVGGDCPALVSPATFRKDTPVQAEIDCQQSHQDDEEYGENTNYHDLYCIQKCSEMMRIISAVRLFPSVTCMATLSHLPPLDNSLIQSWSPPWFLWSWQLHKLGRDRLRSWVISGARLQYFSPPPLSSWKLRSKSCKFSLLKVSQTNDKHKTDGVTSNLETDQVCKIPRMGTEWGKLSF